MSEQWRVPLVIRGEVIDTGEVEFGGRRGGASFKAPDVSAYLDRLALGAPSRMADLYAIGFDGIVDYLALLRARLSMKDNRHLQESYELSRLTSGLSDSILRYHYESLPRYFRPEVVRETADRLVGIDYLEGWVEQPPSATSGATVRIRAFGARCVHVIAGNVPVVGAATLIRNAITRSDAIIKTPSNDPLTSAAIVRTMIDMEPDHPL